MKKNPCGTIFFGAAPFFCLLLIGVMTLEDAFAAPALREFSGNVSKEEVKGVENPHDFNDKTLCALCHTAAPPKLNFDPVTTCVKCHSGNVDNHPVSRHPVGKTPRIKLPPGFPLADTGAVVCYTCHDPHNRSDNKRMLRVEYDSLCSSCHVGY